MIPKRSVLVLLSAALLLLGVRAALALPPGTLVITDIRVDPGPSFEKDLKAAQKSVLGKQGETWHVYFVAFLKKPAAAEDLFVVFYKQGESKHESVNNYPVHTKMGAKIVMADFEIRPDDGFKAGGKYKVLVTRLVGGREDVYASTTLELK